MTGELPVPPTAAGSEGLAALVRDPAGAFVGLDYDGTLSPIVADPAAARAHPAAPAVLTRLAGLAGTLAVITGRPAAEAIDLGGLAGVPGLIVLGHYGWERWQDGALVSPPSPPGVAQARELLPGVLAAAGAPAGIRTEDKGHALAVHTRQAADPQQALARLREPVTALAARTGLTVEPGRLVLELRPAGTDKGSALTGLVSERKSSSVMFAGDDLGDLSAFGAVRALRASGIPGITVCSGSAEVTELSAAADLVVDGPAGVMDLLTALAEAMAGHRPRATPQDRS
ncbi:MAG: trehalose-phosphatase [Nocardiopsaceae bacterium]|nr:trehalose-phosphatase [Nocardiopsaceae bacterium]